mgnify:CR=1 FL=1
MGESYAVRIDADGDETELEVPEALVSALSEPDDSPADVVADVVVMSFAGRAHALLHHTEGEPADDLREAEAEMMDRFEERFGVTYAEATGHSH